MKVKSNSRNHRFVRRARYYLSESGLTNLKTKLHDMYQKRTEQLQRLRSLKEQQSDSLSVEDSGYIDTMSSLKFIEAETERLEEIIAGAEVIHAKPGSRVNLGSRVQLEGSGKRLEYTIVSSIEADPFDGKISDKSPLGRQLLGKRLKDIVTIVLPNKKSQTLRLVGIR